MTLEEQINAIKDMMQAFPRHAGAHAAKFFRENFDKQGFDDNGVRSWKPLARPSKYKILIRTGTLKRSIRVVSSDMRRVVIGSDLPYAAIHNEGGSGTKRVRAHRRRTRTGVSEVREHDRSFNMPQRKFMGTSQTLNRQLYELFQQQLRQRNLIK